ncbi:hypothetical protein A6V39_04555 [Candidatus Mycoplasma haematobovis]|uniref:Ribosomal processing cysteine protease Prp n=1 Tax=Candidatus Mycoplasma haematobovis TaxID=432608 RepID=A0A1A9QDY7_9MOLU|nr:ribosomal-processing cysteine protease Prp [Candidatus Mycoplasma haematobovis]OAL10155.1 hypothetical protein A6V39_04555 [Candidatus Mycoplasma haematobovis]
MTKIIITNNSLLIAGHTNYASKGKDLVCAAISALVTGSAEIWKDNKEIETTIDEDSYYFKFNNLSKVTKIELDFLIKHLKIISNNYSEHIKITYRDFTYCR